MSVLIKGMGMPRNCDNCDFMQAIGEYGEPVCMQGVFIECPTRRPPDCPLIELPPHGRLIDADALIDTGWQLGRDNIFTGNYEVALLSSVPTIIPADPEQEEMK